MFFTSRNIFLIKLFTDRFFGGTKSGSLVALLFLSLAIVRIYLASTQVPLHNLWIMLTSQNGLIILEMKKVNSYVVCGPFGCSHPEQTVTNFRMGAGVGHREPPQTKGCQNLINLRQEQLHLHEG